MRTLHAFGGPKGLLVLAAVVLLNSGCASIVSSAASNFADNLATAISNQNDPELVRDGAPAYLLLLDSLLVGNPDDPMLLAAAANLYASYGAVFADDPARAARLSAHAQDYAKKAICISYSPSCDWDDMDYESFVATLAGLKTEHDDVVYAYGVSSLAYIRAHSEDWNALARLPHMEALLKRNLEIGDGESDGAIYTFLGILVTLRPPALGGQPEKGREYFERAMEIGGGYDLSAKLEFARSYARPLYERELHDRLLSEVLAADAEVPGYTLTNVLAQRDAAELLSSADDFF
jgi:hypothetical protein